MELRTFTDQDWQTFAGTVEPKNELPALIGFVEDGDLSWVVIVDACGLTVTAFNEDGEIADVATVGVSYPAARALGENMTERDVQQFTVAFQD